MLTPITSGQNKATYDLLQLRAASCICMTPMQLWPMHGKRSTLSTNMYGHPCPVLLNPPLQISRLLECMSGTCSSPSLWAEQPL